MVELEDTPGLSPGRLCSVRVQVPLATFMSRYDITCDIQTIQRKVLKDESTES